MTYQVRINTSGTVTDEHIGLLDFGYLTITDRESDKEIKLDSEIYHIEPDCVLVGFDSTQVWDENDMPIETTVDWQQIKELGERYGVELYVGFADDVDDIDAPTIKYGDAVLQFEGGELPITLDNYVDAE